jgi:predicted ATPase
LKYDGGPANPVPYAKGDNGQGGSTIAPAIGLPVSFNKAKSASPYTFKAYGEK